MCSGEMDGVGVSGIPGVGFSVGFQSEIRRGSDGSGRISALPGEQGSWTSIFSGTERDMACRPVNQWIVLS